MVKQEVGKDIWLIENFLSAEECAALIQLSETKGYERAKVNLNGTQTDMPSVRDNDRVLHFDTPLANQYWLRLREFMPKEGQSEPIGLNELWRFYRYQPGQRFRKHRDGSYFRSEFEASFYTFIVYLNDDFEGGATSFGDLQITPKIGMALIFAHAIRHEGLATTSGLKYVLRSDIMYKLKFDA